MGGFGNLPELGNTQPKNIPTQRSISKPKNTGIENKEQKRLKTIISQLSNSGDISLMTLSNSLKNIAVYLPENDKGVSDTLSEMEKYFNQNRANIDSNFFTVFNSYVKKLRNITAKYRQEKEKITLQKQAKEQALIYSKFLKDSDNPFAKHISVKLEVAEGKKLSELISMSRSIELTGEIAGKDSWDKFFDDLRDAIPKSDLPAFEKDIAEFKEENPDLYNKESNNGKFNSSFDAILTEIESGDLDKEFEKGYTLEVLFGATLGLGGSMLEVGPFYDKKEAVKTIYKMKLVFKEVESNSVNILMWYLDMATDPAQALIYENEDWSAWGDIKDIGEKFVDDPLFGIVSAGWNLPMALAEFTTGVLLTGLILAIPPGIPLLIGGSGVINARRKIIDKLSKDFGDRGWAKNINKSSENLTKFRKGLWNSKIPFLKYLTKVGAGVLFPFDLTGKGVASLFSSAESLNLDMSNLFGDNVVLIDGVSSTVDGESNDHNANKIREIRTRAKVLEIEIREAQAEGDIKKLQALQKLKDKGSFVTNTESFYLELKDILDLDDNIPETKTGRVIKGTLDAFWIRTAKEPVLNFHRDRLQHVGKLMKLVYDDVAMGDYKTSNIEINDRIKKTKFYSNMLANIEYSLIDDALQTEREEYLNGILKRLERGELGYIKDEVRFKQEIVRIVDGYLPTYKIIEKIGNAQSSFTQGSVEWMELETIRKRAIDGTFFGDEQLVDRIIVNRSLRNYSTPNISDEKVLFNQGKEYKLNQIKERKIGEYTDMNKYTSLFDNIKLQEELGIISGSNNNLQSIEVELTGYFEKIIEGEAKCTKQEFFFTVGRIFSGDEYDDRFNGGQYFGGNNNIDDLINNSSLNNINSLEKFHENKLISGITGVSDFSTKLEYIRKIENLPILKQKLDINNSYKVLVNNIFSYLDIEIQNLEGNISSIEEKYKSEYNKIKGLIKEGDNLFTKNSLILAESIKLNDKLEDIKGEKNIYKRIGLFDDIKKEIIKFERHQREFTIEVTKLQNSPNSTPNSSQQTSRQQNPNNQPNQSPDNYTSYAKKTIFENIEEGKLNPRFQQMLNMYFYKVIDGLSIDELNDFNNNLEANIKELKNSLKNSKDITGFIQRINDFEIISGNKHINTGFTFSEEGANKLKKSFQENEVVDLIKRAFSKEGIDITGLKVVKNGDQFIVKYNGNEFTFTKLDEDINPLINHLKKQLNFADSIPEWDKINTDLFTKGQLQDNIKPIKGLLLRKALRYFKKAS